MRIRDIVIIDKVKAPKGTVPYLEIGNINIESKQYILTDKESVSGACYAKKGDIVVSTVRPTRGAISMLKEDLSVSSALTILRANPEKCLAEYLFYALNNPHFFEYLGSKQSGATYPTCSSDDIYDYEIKFESDLDKQKKIVESIKSIHELLENRKLQLKDLYLLLDNEYYEMTKDSDERKSIKDIIMPTNNIKADDRIIKYIDISSINKVQNSVDSMKEYILKDAPTRARQIVYKNDVLYSGVRPNLKTVALLDKNEDNMIASTGFIILRPNDQVIPEFLFRSVLSKEFTDAMVLKTTGAAYPAVNYSDVVNYEIKWIDIEKQEKFKTKYLNIKEQIDLTIDNINDLKQLLESKIMEYFKVH